MELQKLIYTVEDGVAVVTMNYMKILHAQMPTLSSLMKSALCNNVKIGEIG